MNDYVEWTFRFLHDRSAREAFVRGAWDEIGVPFDMRADLDMIDREDLSRAAEKVQSQLHAILTREHPQIFAAWAEISPQDASGRGLVEMYTASRFYRESVNFAWREDDESLASAFPKFLLEMSRGEERR